MEDECDVRRNLCRTVQWDALDTKYCTSQQPARMTTIFEGALKALSKSSR